MRNRNIDFSKFSLKIYFCFNEHETTKIPMIINWKYIFVLILFVWLTFFLPDVIELSLIIVKSLFELGCLDLYKKIHYFVFKSTAHEDKDIRGKKSNVYNLSLDYFFEVNKFVCDSNCHLKTLPHICIFVCFTHGTFSLLYTIW